MSWRHWLYTASLSLLSLIVSQLLPLHFSFENQLSPLAVAQNPVVTLTVFAAMPFMLAAAFLNPGAALLVGLFGGLGRSLGQSPFPFDIFALAFVAVQASLFMRQSYKGRLFKWLRQPVITGVLNTISLMLLLGISTYASSNSGASKLAALDLALSTAGANFWSLLVEGLVGGGVVWLAMVALPQLRPPQTLIPSPLHQKLHHRLLSNFALFAVLITGLMAVVVFNLSINTSTRLVVNQMAHDAQSVSAVIPDFQTQLHNVLGLINRYNDLSISDSESGRKALQEIYQANSLLYRYLILVNADQEIIASYPNDDEELRLTEEEKAAVAAALTNETPETTLSKRIDNAGDHIFSLAMPVRIDSGKPTAVLIGRVPQLSLNNLIVGLDGTVGLGTGYIVNEDGYVIADAGSEVPGGTWEPPESVRPIQTETTEPGIAFQSVDSQSNARELVYFLKSEDHSWTIVTKVPYEVVLNLSLGIGGPLTFVLIAVMGLFSANLAFMGRDIASPITELVQVSKMITAGGKWTPSDLVQRDDEIGQLKQAFYQMYQSRNKRLNELLLLLGISHEVSSNVNINRGMAAILRGTLRGTIAVGARAVVLNPSGRYPLQFGEGPMATSMAPLDRRVMSRLRHRQELLTLSTKAEIRRALGLPEAAELPIAAIIAIPLHSQNRFQGIVWLGYGQPHRFDQEERNLLQTLAGQAAVLVENARLFANAEGGRRRLAAVLSSTADAVIVTDQTNRILLVNRATEQLFELKKNRVVGRVLADVIKVKELIDALTDSRGKSKNLEIPIGRDKTYFANVSTITNNEGQTMGRVAVLHDITHYKEIDKMKSDFVQSVSHDLRNPLTFIRGYVTMLPMVGDVNEDQQKYIDKIQAGIEQMRLLVDDVLDLGRIEAGIELHAEELPVRTLLMDVATEHWHHARAKGLQIDVEVNPDTPPVFADKLLIRQAITNLVTNGIKYAPNSGSLKLKGELVDGDMVFSVKDKGPGISPQDQMRLFEKFYRANQRGEENIKGVGLGLAIVKSIAERHGGRAWCVSQQGIGSTFYISIPQNQPGRISSG